MDQVNWNHNLNLIKHSQNENQIEDKLKQIIRRKHNPRNGNELGLPNWFKLNNHFCEVN